MSRRMTDTAKWDDDWFMNLSPMTKLLWFYLCDNCDHAGVWKVNRRLVDFKVGATINWEESLAELGDRVTIIGSGDRWFIRKFVEFQYGYAPNEKNPAHAGVLKVLSLHGLTWSSKDPSQALTSPIDGVKEKEKEKEKERDKDMVSRGSAEGVAEHRKIFQNLLIRLLVADGSQAVRRWWALSGQHDLSRTFDDRCDFIAWLVNTARGRGMTVRFASDVIELRGEWPGPRPRDSTQTTTVADEGKERA